MALAKPWMCLLTLDSSLDRFFYFSTFSLVQEKLKMGKSVEVSSFVSFSSCLSCFQDHSEMLPLDVR